jgi:hypothetical protein
MRRANEESNLTGGFGGSSLAALTICILLDPPAG